MVDLQRNDDVVGDPRLAVEVLAVRGEVAARMCGMSLRTKPRRPGLDVLARAGGRGGSPWRMTTTT